MSSEAALSRLFLTMLNLCLAIIFWRKESCYFRYLLDDQEPVNIYGNGEEFSLW
ncbi:MAG: hypothetical protein ACJAR6_000925 [Oleispira sp.]|jgi:hypothetical protein